jgi:hypothetical protein
MTFSRRVGHIWSSGTHQHPADITTCIVQSFQEEFFYAWQYEREASPWLYVFSALVVVVVIAACLFPLAPYPVRLGVVYTSMALLSAILAIIVVRSIIAGVSWVALGRSLWLFPYLLSEVLTHSRSRFLTAGCFEYFLGEGTTSSASPQWINVLVFLPNYSQLQVTLGR